MKIIVSFLKIEEVEPYSVQTTGLGPAVFDADDRDIRKGEPVK